MFVTRCVFCKTKRHVFIDETYDRETSTGVVSMARCFCSVCGKQIEILVGRKKNDKKGN